MIVNGSALAGHDACKRRAAGKRIVRAVGRARICRIVIHFCKFRAVREHAVADARDAFGNRDFRKCSAAEGIVAEYRDIIERNGRKIFKPVTSICGKLRHAAEGIGSESRPLLQQLYGERRNNDATLHRGRCVQSRDGPLRT